MQIKEFLDTEKGYVLVKDTCKRSEDWIEVPEGAECLTVCEDDDKNKWYLFWRGDCKFCVGYDNDWYDFGSVSSMTEYLDAWDGSARIVWQRPQQPESLPFIDDEVQSINDQYAEIEQVRQDMINHPSHYTQGKVECIDALESATIGKSGIEAVCVANIIKYLWRYEEKNGIEDVKKAQFYLNRLLATLENNNG